MFFVALEIQLVPDSTIFIHIALILAMIWLLNRTFFRPIGQVIDERDRQKGGEGSEADNILKTAAGKEADYNKTIQKARSEGYQLIENAHNEAVADRENKLATAKDETASQLAGEKASIEQQTAAARASIASDADAMAERIAASILKA